jgi:hypothetical protein
MPGTQGFLVATFFKRQHLSVSTGLAVMRTWIQVATGQPIPLAMPMDLPMVQLWLHGHVLYIHQMMETAPQTSGSNGMVYYNGDQKVIFATVSVAGNLHKTRWKY